MKKQLLLLLSVTLFTQVFAQNNAKNTFSDSEYVLKFDDTTEHQSIKYADDATSSMMDGATDYTVEMWVYPFANSIVDDVWLGMRNMLRFTFYTNNRFYFTHKDNSSGTPVNTFYNVTNDAITLDQWNHIALICDSTDGANGSIKLYVNGVDVSAQSYDAKPLVGGDANNDVFVSYGGGDYSNMYAREVRIKNIVEDISNLHVDINDPNYETDANTAVLFHFAEGSGLTTVNTASGVDANFGYSGAHYPTWVLFADTLGNSEYNTTDFSMFPNPTKNQFTIQTRINESIQSIEIVNVLGQTVKSLQFDIQINKINVNVADLAKGQYFVTTKTNIGQGVRNLIIK